MQLSEPMRRYVYHWGEMGQRWGVSRSVAQVHALLYLAEAPLTAEDIVGALGIARSNVSTSLRELQGWDLVRLVHRPGDRRDHFEAKHDPWDVMMAIVEGRKRREIDPTLAMLREIKAQADPDMATPPMAKARITLMLGHLEEMDAFYAHWRAAPRPMLKKLMALGDKLAQLIGR